ncbi:hypothetical protein K438DRAFT_1754347 [Mycena galopus ATCC 62051]|nr:hypothetical protein K438DRAFT_1754347 [Mycena galopus ATCC 62051]
MHQFFRPDYLDAAKPGPFKDKAEIILSGKASSDDILCFVRSLSGCILDEPKGYYMYFPVLYQVLDDNVVHTPDLRDPDVCNAILSGVEALGGVVTLGNHHFAGGAGKELWARMWPWVKTLIVNTELPSDAISFLSKRKLLVDLISLFYNPTDDYDRPTDAIVCRTMGDCWYGLVASNDAEGMDSAALFVERRFGGGVTLDKDAVRDLIMGAGASPFTFSTLAAEHIKTVTESSNIAPESVERRLRPLIAFLNSISCDPKFSTDIVSSVFIRALTSVFVICAPYHQLLRSRMLHELQCILFDLLRPIPGVDLLVDAIRSGLMTALIDSAFNEDIEVWRALMMWVITPAVVHVKFVDSLARHITAINNVNAASLVESRLALWSPFPALITNCDSMATKSKAPDRLPKFSCSMRSPSVPISAKSSVVMFAKSPLTAPPNASSRIGLRATNRCATTYPVWRLLTVGVVKSVIAEADDYFRVLVLEYCIPFATKNGLLSAPDPSNPRFVVVDLLRGYPEYSIEELWGWTGMSDDRITSRHIEPLCANGYLVFIIQIAKGYDEELWYMPVCLAK